jgi:hypothetical protein
MSVKLCGRVKDQMEKAEIITGYMATLKRLREAMAAREEAKREAAKREEAKRERKKAWQLSELARIEQGGMEGPTAENPPGYGGYLDGYCGAV